MKAISIRQPWAWAIVHCGKDIENRTWHTSYRGEVLIHACTLPPLTKSGRVPARIRREMQHGLDAIVLCADTECVARAVQTLTYNQLRAQSGGFVARARIVDCVRKSASPWFSGEWGFVLANVEPLDLIPCKGQLGLWDVPERIAEAVER